MASKTAKGTTLQNALSASLNAETSAVQDRFSNRFARLETLQNAEPGRPEGSAADEAPHEAREDRDHEEGRGARSVSQSSPSSQEEAAIQESRGQSLVIRDSFTMPETDYALIARTRERCLDLRRNVTKAEVLRAGLAALDGLDDAQLLALFESLPKVKTGRPMPTRAI